LVSENIHHIVGPMDAIIRNSMGAEKGVKTIKVIKGKYLK